VLSKQVETGMADRNSVACWEKATRLWSMRGADVLERVLRCYMNQPACAHLLSELLG